MDKKVQGGAKTEQGKAKVRFNARKHGILGEVKTKYEGGVHDSYMQRLHDHYHPVGFMECLLVRRIADACLMLFRANKAEREFMLTRLQPKISDTLGDFDYDKDSYKPVMHFEDVERLTTIYLRYQTTIENRLYKAMHELERLQRMRMGEHIPSPVPVDVMHDGEFVSQN